MPPQFEDCIFRLQSAGYVAILTHPERLSWIEPQYILVRRMMRPPVSDADRYTLIIAAISRGQVANERTFNPWF
jgi:tyrosine-protein phosphatase YwqE